MKKQKLWNYSHSHPKNKQTTIPQKIDVVYTYVHYQDHSFQNKIKQYKKNIDLVRYRDMNEIYYSLQTLEFFAKNIVGSIYIVSMNQSLDDKQLSPWIRSKILYISHEEIIPSEYLPTFNSITIEGFLYKIPNLSETFLYLNDDMFIGNYLSMKDIFTEKGIPKVYVGRLKEQAKRNKNKPWLDYYLNGYDLFQSHYPNIYCDIKPVHSVYILQKSVFEEMWKVFGEELKQSISQFRESKNINIWFLSYLMGIYMGEMKPTQVNDKISIYFHCDTESDEKKIEYIRKIVKMKPLFLNINNMDEKCLPIFDFFKKNYFRLFAKK